MWLWWQRLHSEVGLGWGRAESSAAGHPFAPRRGRGAVRVQHAGSIKTATTPKIRGSDNSTTARVLRPRCSRGLVGQGTDVSVAQAVVDQGEQLAGRSDLGDVAAAAVLDPLAIEGDLGGVRLALDGLHGRPPHEFAALFGDVPAAHDGVRFAVPGSQPSPRA